MLNVNVVMPVRNCKAFAIPYEFIMIALSFTCDAWVGPSPVCATRR